MKVAFALVALASAVVSRTAAGDVLASFPAGSGARYAFSSSAGSAELTISVAESSAARVVVELYFSRPGLLASEMWQQYVLAVPTSGAVSVQEGYLLLHDGSPPERIPNELLAGLDDATLSDFLIANRADIDRYRQAPEQVQVRASGAPVDSVRYQQTSGPQTLTYWLSDQAKPVRLVKLRSRGVKASQSYELELVALLKNVGHKIDRAHAVPIGAEGRAVLQTKLP